MLESLARNAPDPHYWTLNSCFDAFLSIRVHFGPFRYCTKLGAKRAKLVQLMQMFMPQCRARIFRNERSRSTPLDPKLMFWCVFSVWVHLEPFCYCTKLAAKRTKLDPKLMFSCISFPFGCISDRFATARNSVQIGQLVQLMQEFVPQSLVRISQN